MWKGIQQKRLNVLGTSIYLFFIVKYYFKKDDMQQKEFFENLGF
jgi:hypothetical protein